MAANAPIRPQQHRTGDAATRAFEGAVPARWVTNPSRSDYGWDYIVTLSAADVLRMEGAVLGSHRRNLRAALGIK